MTTKVPEQNPKIEYRVEGDKYIVKATMWVELDHMGRPWRIPQHAPATAGADHG